MNAGLMSLAPPDQRVHVRAQEVLNQHAKSFAWASRFLSADAKHDVAVLYAFARMADDLADEESLGPLHQRMAQLQELLDTTRAAPRKTRAASTSIANAAGVLLCKYGLNTQVLEHFIECLRQDAQARHLQSPHDLLAFCYGAAGTVGLLIRPILGAPLAGDSYALALGVGMQLTNIARDVVEDAARGRCYVPAHWCALAGVTQQTLTAPQNAMEREQAFALIEKLLLWAEDFYAYAYTGIPLIAPDNRLAIKVAATLYRAIGRKIMRGGPHWYWLGRTHLTPLEKARLIMGVAIRGEAAPQQPVRNVVLHDLAPLRALPGFPQ
jgi:15-cis-phytoene synthase